MESTDDLSTPLLQQHEVIVANESRSKDSSLSHGALRRPSLQSTRPDYLASLRRVSIASLEVNSPLHSSFRKTKQVNQNNVEVRIKNYSHTVAIRKDAPSIKTVFNTSPCYVGMELVGNIGEIITGRKKVR